MVKAANLVPIATTDGLEDGTMKRVDVQGRAILLARVGGKYYAIDNTCPHMGGNLSGGKLEGTVVTCPRHGSQFDVRDGHLIRWMRGSGIASTIGKALKSPRSAVAYNLRTEGDKILIEV